MMQFEVGPNLLSALLAGLALVGSVTTAVLSYLNGKRMKQVEKNTNGMTEKMVEAAFREGKALGHKEELASQQAATQASKPE